MTKTQARMIADMLEVVSSELLFVLNIPVGVRHLSEKRIRDELLECIERATRNAAGWTIEDRPYKPTDNE